MDLPAEDKTALAKRRAIKAVMADASLSAADRSKRMQDIMRGNFPVDDSDDDESGGGESEGSGSYESGSDSESSRSAPQRRSTATSDGIDDASMESTQSDSSGGSRSLSIGDSRASSRRSSYSSHYSRSDSAASARTEDDSPASSDRGSGSGHNASSNSNNHHRKLSREMSGRSASSAASSSGASAASASAQKDKQKALLEISRDKSLSVKERQAKMKEVMQTNVSSFHNSQGSSLRGSEGDTGGGDDSETGLDYMAGSGRRGSYPRRASTHSRNDMMDSVRECTLEEDHGVRPLRTSRSKMAGHVRKIEELTRRLDRNDATLTEIELRNMHLTDEDVIPLLDALGKNATVTSLDLRRNRIGTEGCSTLAATILDNDTLTKVDIGGNNLGDEGMEDLAKVLPYNKTLTTLVVEDNKVGDAGATALAEALAENATLTSIHLGGNLIGDAGAVDLFKVLGSSNDAVTELRLPSNAISDGGATELASALLDNETLAIVDLGQNKITNKGATDLLKVVGINDTLEALELGGNVDVDEEVVEDVQRALEEEADETDSGSDSGVSASYSESYSESHSERSSAGRRESNVTESASENELEDGAADEGPSAASDGDVALTGGEAMLQDMPDESEAQLAKRQLIQQIQKDASLSPSEKMKKMQDVMAGRVELPKVEKKKAEPEPQAAAASDGANDKGPSAASDGDVALTGGEAMLQDMPDESEAQLAKRQLIQQIQKDTSLSPSEKMKKMQDVMAGRVELPKVEKKKAESKPQAAAASDGAKEEGPSAASDGDIALTGGEAMLQDMPDESEAQLAKRQLIQQIQKDTSLTPKEKMKKMQDVMAGRVELPKVEKKKGEPAREIAEAESDGSSSESESSYSESDDDSHGSSESPPPPVKSRSPPPSTKSKSPPPPKAVATADKRNERRPVKQIVATKTTNVQTKSRSGRQSSSYDGGARNAIASEWKRHMMSVHPHAHDNLLDVNLAHQYRLSLQTPPKQSFFRVVAVIFFSRIGPDGTRRDERYHVAGTNDEPHAVGGSICAERAALMQLRFVPDLDLITKIVIVTDDADAISPGMLCREFMASHDRIPWDVPIVMGRSVCRKCGFTISGKVCGDANGCFDMAGDAELRNMNSNIFATCERGHEEAKNKDYPTPHDFVGSVTTLRDLFPHPSLYTRLTSRKALAFGEEYLEQSSNSLSKSKSKEGKEAKLRAYLANGDRRFNDDASKGSYRQENFDLRMLSNIMEESNESDKNLGASATSNGVASNQKDSFTSHSTVSRRKAPGSTLTMRSGSMSQSLSATIDFMRQVREDRHELDTSGLSGLSDLPGTLEHLTARTLRISSRLKPSQRREKLMRLATEVTALESHQKHAHPIRYGAAVLFSDGIVAIASQKVALEYGCTLDAVGQLASMIDKKAIQIEEDGPPCRPVLLVQCDQFGIAHAPFAAGRAYLTERGYGDCKVLIHQRRQAANGEGGQTQRDPPVGDEDDGDAIDLRLLEVEANDLAPAPPDIFGGLMTKNHSQQGGLQIQF